MVHSRLHCALLRRRTADHRAAVHPTGAAGWALHSRQSRRRRRRSSDESPPPPLGRCLATRRDPDRNAATPRRLRADHAVRTRLGGSAQQVRSWASQSTSSAPATSCIHWQRGTLARTGNSPCRRPPAPAAPRGTVGEPVPTYAALQRPIPTCPCGCAGACACACECAGWACCAWCLLQVPLSAHGVLCP